MNPPEVFFTTHTFAKFTHYICHIQLADATNIPLTIEDGNPAAMNENTAVVVENSAVDEKEIDNIEYETPITTVPLPVLDKAEITDETHELEYKKLTGKIQTLRDDLLLNASSSITSVLENDLGGCRSHKTTRTNLKLPTTLSYDSISPISILYLQI